MKRQEAISDLKALKDFFMEQSGGSYPLSLDYAIGKLSVINPKRKKDLIQKFHDYQVEWLTSHCDLELEPQLEEWVIRFLHDTANCFMLEMDRGDQNDCK